MTGLAFFDTNVLLYSEDRSASNKRQIADAVFAEHVAENTAVVSLQVLQEYYSTATRKFGLDPALAQARVEVLAGLRVVRFEPPDIVAAIQLHRLVRISFWDALIVHAAQVAGAQVLYTEDLQHNAVFGSVRVVNPFVEA